MLELFIFLFPCCNAFLILIANYIDHAWYKPMNPDYKSFE